MEALLAAEARGEMNPEDGLRDFLLKLETYATYVKIPVFSTLLRMVRGRRIYVGGIYIRVSTRPRDGASGVQSTHLCPR